MAEITREQLDKVLDKRNDGCAFWAAMAVLAMSDAPIPDDVRDAGTNWCDMVAALTRWRDSLPVAKVARWDAARGAYVLTPPITDDYRATTDPYAAIAWGYTIEGGPEVAEDSPERLKARREALGWSMTDAALALGGACDERDIGHYEAHDDGCCMPLRTAYAAALSAAEAEARRAAQPEPVRFQLGDLVRAVNCNGSPDNGREFIVHKVVGSTAPTTALAQRLVAHPRWRWEPGMMGYLSGGVREPILAPLTGLHPSLALDIEHPATKGWLLAMLRGATGTQDVCAAWVGSSWRLYGWIGASALGRFANEGDALASALLAVWGAP